MWIEIQTFTQENALEKEADYSGIYIYLFQYQKVYGDYNIIKVWYTLFWKVSADDLRIPLMWNYDWMENENKSNKIRNILRRMYPRSHLVMISPKAWRRHQMETFSALLDLFQFRDRQD